MRSLRLLTLLSLVFAFSSSVSAQFVNVAPGTDAAVSGNKDGGLAWGDFNNDGCLDLLVNTADGTARSRLLQNNCSAVSPELIDVTAALAPGLLRDTKDRAALLVDLNNDGYLDIVRNRFRQMEIYFNNGPVVPPMIGDDYTFGTGATLTPNIVLGAWSMLGDFNIEGIGAADVDGDGFLDLLVENHDDGIALMLNGGDGTFSQTPAAGLPGAGSSTDGDYLSVADLDGDGNMDVVGRKNGAADIYYGNGDGTFTVDAVFNQPASNGNKGGVTPCDIDGDGRLDLFWTDAGTNQFWRQSAARTWTATGQPASGIAGNIDGASCGDVDNDGDMDLFLTSSGTDHLFLNNGSGVFTRNNLGIAGATDSEGSQFADYDNDGDLDLAVNTDGAAQLWENQTGGSDFLMVTPVVALPGGRTRPETGATARIVAAFGAAPFQGPITQVDGGSGHGVSGPGEIHLGLGDGNSAFYTLTVKFPGGAEVTRCVQPSALTGQSISLLASDRSTLCDDQDGDDIPDVVDVDDDNDGILDVTEVAGITGDPSADNDGDGVPNYADPDHTPGGCASVGGVCTSLPTAVDVDEDGIPNHLDRDADGDGITDVRESGGDDSDGDGRPDACTATNALGACVSGALAGAPTNTDGGQPDYLDPDSDGDGLLDRVEAFDTNGNGTLNGAETTASGNDADNDGIDNAYDPDFAGGDPVTDADATALDADGNGTPNWQQVCGDAYVRGAEACDTGSASATCTAMCLRTDGEDCTSAGQCDAAICTAGICGLVVSVDLADPDAGGPLTTTTTTPSGTSSGFAAGSTVTVRVTGPGGFDATCMATVAASGAWMCSAAITGLDQGATYTAVASGTSAGMSVMDSETFVTGDCAGLDEGDVCDGGVCDADGGGGSCVVCADTMSGAGLDDGCAAAAPLCVSVGGAPTCVACVDSTNGGTDDGCGAAGPVCDDSNAASPVCVVCEDNESGDMADNGCMAPNALCAEPVGMAAMCVECLMDSQCTVAGEVCGGDNTCVPGCNEMSDCEGTPLPICDLANRTCVECLTDDECLGSQVCSAGGMCVFGDSDMDNVPDDVDLDDDNDGILDADELGGDDLSDDSNDNGVPDYNDAALQACDDMNGDLMCDSVLPQFDFDGDGIPNHLDRDADGDGLVDTVEGGGIDDDGNGIVDGFADVNGNGLSDALEGDALPIPNTDEVAGPDFLDLDSDDDGLTDSVEGGGTDDDGNGQPDGAAADTNLDGIDDSLFGASALPAPDSDGDDTPDYQDIDSDDDGIIDATEAFDDDMDGNPDVMASGADTDMDGLDDAFDPDCIDAVCGGVIGVLAPEPNSDSDMLPDWRDVDSDADGITDGVECPVPAMCSDSDMDGTPDYLEVDADGDGLPDAAEGHDADHDGTPDVEPSGTDTDMDGLDDAFDGDCVDAACGGVVGVVAPTPDLDMDGRPDFQDADDDGDSILTATEIQDAADYVGPATTPSDVDEDGLPNWYDTDSDGDDTPDLTEDTRPTLDGDLDDNDILDYLDPGFAPADTDGDGIIDALECLGISPPDDTCPDSDGDGQPDYDDVDDDNDGVLTRDEYAAADPDDGDIENDHDADNDGVPNHLDIDADNDGIPDLWENGGAEFDADGDGQVDAAADDDGDGLLAVFDADDADKTNFMTDEPTNTDGNGPADYLDLDSDDDGLLDILEANGTDADSDGRVDDAADADMDGLADIVDPSDGGTPWETPDTDEDGAFDFQDVDADNDGVPDINEGNDLNEDGIADWRTSGADSDRDGIDDAFEAAFMGTAPALPDTDGDDIPNFRDVDDDGDGVPTPLEDLNDDGDRSNDDTDGDLTPNYLDSDDDGDGVPTRTENPDPNDDGSIDDAQDTDLDGTPDYLDVDDDGDGVLTRFEQPDPNGDGDVNDARDTNEDGTPDYLDPDDDGDGIPTLSENADPDGDGDPADAVDTDGDGTPDYLDPNGSTGGGLAGGAMCSAHTGAGTPPLWLLALGAFVAWRRRR